MSDVFMIGIAGGSGSGKTTLTKAIMDFCQEKASVIYHDNYYKAFNDLSYDERSRLNYDHPDASQYITEKCPRNSSKKIKQTLPAESLA